MGAKHYHYSKVTCPWCGRYIATNTFGRHQDACPKKPVDRMTLGEVLQRGITPQQFNEAMRKEEHQ